ncbi:hypothetical protein [Paenibacillus koleovorans]|uniref:hypothetical protein n=1 Tax=Paenibacillus koleovorans TaxID=121608 RepID=UPI000FD74B40|nr:hypothetical protein [Paenibacillus koleovorans]
MSSSFGRFSKKVLSIALGIGVLSGSLLAGTASASGNIWYDKYVALESTIGNNLYNSYDSGVLGWGESYILQSYVNMYKTTKDTGWLDKFTTHMDTMLTHVNDDDGDGYDTWDSPGYSPIDVENESFETPNASDSTLPNKWVRWQSNSSTAYRDNGTNSKVTGNWGLMLKTNGTTWQKMYQKLTNYETSARYTLRFQGRINASAVVGRVYVRDETAGVNLADVTFNNTTFQYYEVNFMMPSASNHDIRVWLAHQDYAVSGGIAYFDDVKVSGRYPYIIQDAMVGVAMADFIQLINQTPSLQTAYLTKSNTYQSFIENEMVPKWTNSAFLGNSWNNISATEGSYTQPPNKATLDNNFPGRNLAYNMSLGFADMLYTMYTVNGNSTYLDKAKKINQYFKYDLSVSGTAYDWTYGEFYTAREDISHALVDLGAVINMYRNGQIYNGTDMNRFTSTLVNKMWNGSLATPTVTYYVNGTGNTNSSRSLSNWVELSQFNSTVWKIAAEQYRSWTPDIAARLLTLSQIIAWDPEKIVNQGMEFKNVSDATLPARWTRFQATSANVYLDSTNKYSGDNAITIKADGSTWTKLYQVWEEWQPSTSYTISFMGKTDGSGANGRVAVYNQTTGASIQGLTFTNSTWQPYSFTFTTPATGTNEIRIYIGNNDYTFTNGKAHVDDIVIKRTGDSF